MHPSGIHFVYFAVMMMAGDLFRTNGELHCQINETSDNRSFHARQSVD